MLDLATGVLSYKDIMITPDVRLDDFIKYPGNRIEVCMHKQRKNCGSIHFTEHIPSNGVEAGVTIEFDAEMDIKDVRILPCLRDFEQLSPLEAGKQWLRGFAIGNYTETNHAVSGVYPWGYLTALYIKDQHYGKVEGGIEVSYGMKKHRPETIEDAVLLRSQASTKYMCRDSWQMETIQDDHIFICTTDAQHIQILKREVPSEVSGFFTDQASVDYCKKNDILDNSRLNRILQVAPLQMGDDDDPAYKPHVECLYIEKDLLEKIYGTRDFNAAVAKCNANNQFGEGGGNQGMNPHIAEMIGNGCLRQEPNEGYSDPTITALPELMRNHGTMNRSVVDKETYATMMLDAKIRAVDCLFQTKDQKEADNSNVNTEIEMTVSLNKNTKPIYPEPEYSDTGTLFFGGFGTGSVNFFHKTLPQIQLAQNDIMVFFETNAGFYHDMYQAGDVVISYGDIATGTNGKPDYWNIFHEVTYGKMRDANIVKIVKNLFQESWMQGNDLMFPYAVRDIFQAIMLHFVRYCEDSGDNRYRNNASFVQFIYSKNSKDIWEMLNSYPDMHALAFYAEDYDSPKTQQIFSELRQCVREIFAGNFAKRGSLGIRELIHNREGKKIFINAAGHPGGLCTPPYSLFVDLAVEEASCRNTQDGNIYFLTDDIRLLSVLQNITDSGASAEQMPNQMIPIGKDSGDNPRAHKKILYFPLDVKRKH